MKEKHKTFIHTWFESAVVFILALVGFLAFMYVITMLYRIL
jgi:hypothetical protein